MNKIRLLNLALATAALSACAARQSAAPPAPCASIERDCGPARPVNDSFAQLHSTAAALARHSVLTGDEAAT